MIRKKLRVSPGSWWPIVASVFALVTAASFAVFFRVTMEQARFVPRIMNPQADIDGKAVDTLSLAGWGLMFGGMVLMVLFLWFLAKKSLAAMIVPVLLYAAGAILSDWKDITGTTGFSTERWIILGSIIVVSWLFLMVATNTIRAKEPLILIGVLAAIGIAVLTFLQREPFLISDASFTAKSCLDLTRLIQVAGYFVTIVLFSLSLENAFRTDVSAVTDNKEKKPSAEEKAESKAAKKAAAEAKSDGKTVNWALLRPTETAPKKEETPEETAEEEKPIEETAVEKSEGIGFEALESLSLDEANRRIAEMTQNGPTFEEEMNLVGEIGERKDAAVTEAVKSESISSEPGVEVIQYTAPSEEETPAEEKTLAQLLAERGLLNRTEDPIAQADARRAENAAGTQYDSFFNAAAEREAAAREAAAAKEKAEKAAALEEAQRASAAEAVLNITEPETFTEDAEAEIKEKAETVAAEAGAAEEIWNTANEAASEAAEDIAGATATAGDAAETAAEAAAGIGAAAVAATAFSKAGRKTVFDEMEEQAEETAEESATEFAAKGKSKRANRAREAAERVASEEPILTTPVSPVSGNRLQKVLKEEVITDRDQKLVYRRKVSVFAVIGMCLSVAAMVVGVLTTFDIVKIDMLNDDKSCLMMLGLGLVMFLVFGTRLTYKDYYTKTVVNERKVVHEENNWEEYVANRLEEDEKNIATLAQNYMRMTEMYGRLLETTAELTNNIKALSMSRQVGIEAAPEPDEFAAAEPAEEMFTAAEPAVEEFAAAEPFAPVFAEAEPETKEFEEAAEAVSEEVAETVETAAEEVVEQAETVEEFAEPVEAVAEEVTETAEAVTEEIAETVETATEEAAETVEAAAEEFVEQAETVAEFAEPVEAAAEEVTETAEAVTEEVAETAETVTEEVAETIEAATEEATETVETAAEEVAEQVETVAEEAAKPVEAAAEEVKKDAATANADILAALFSGRNKKAEPVAEKKAEPVEEVKPVVTETAKAEETAEDQPKPSGSYNDFLISTLFGRKKEKPAPVEEATKEVVSEAVEEATEAVPEAIEEAAEEVTETVSETIEEATETVPEVIEEVTETVPEAIEEVTEAVPEAIEEAAEEVTETVSETIEETAEEVTENVEEATEAVSDTIGDLSEDLPKAAEEIAAEAVQEAVEGTEEITEEFANARSEVAEAIEGISDTSEDRIPEYIAAPQGSTSEAVKAVADSIQEPAWRIPSPVFGSFGYGATLADEDTDSDNGDSMKLQFSGSGMEGPMFSDEPMQNIYTPVEPETAEMPAEEFTPAEEYAPAAAETVEETVEEFAPAATKAVEEAVEEFAPAATEAVEEAVEEFAPAEEFAPTEAFAPVEPEMPETAAEAFSEEPGFAEEPVAQEFAAEEPAAEEPAVEEPVAEEPVAEDKPETATVPEWKPSDEPKKAPFYRPSIYGEESLEDAVNNEQMPTVVAPTQREPEQKQDDGIIEGFVMPTFRGFTYSDEYEPTDDDTEEQMYNGSYKMKSFLSRKTSQSEQMQQYLYGNDDDDDFSIQTDDTPLASQYHGVEIPEPEVTEDEGDMFAEPELPMTEADFAEPELPEAETGAWEEAVEEPVMPTWGMQNPYQGQYHTAEPEMAVEPEVNTIPENVPDAPAEQPQETEAPSETVSPQTPLSNWRAKFAKFQLDEDPMADDPLADDWDKPAKEPEHEETEEETREKVENRRRMLQEKLEQIRKKNQTTQFDDLSDLDDEGVFFNNKN